MSFFFHFLTFYSWVPAERLPLRVNFPELGKHSKIHFREMFICSWLFYRVNFCLLIAVRFFWRKCPSDCISWTKLARYFLRNHKVLRGNNVPRLRHFFRACGFMLWFRVCNVMLMDMNAQNSDLIALDSVQTAVRLNMSPFSSSAVAVFSFKCVGLHSAITYIQECFWLQKPCFVQKLKTAQRAKELRARHWPVKNVKPSCPQDRAVRCAGEWFVWY